MSERDDSPAEGVSRRRVVAGAAWAAPAILVAAAAPAAAANSGAVAIAVYTFSQNGVSTVWSASQGANVVTAFKGETRFSVPWDATHPVTSLTLTLTTPAAGLTTTLPTYSGAGWSAIAPTLSGDGLTMTYVFSFTGSVGANAASPALTFSLVGDGTTRKDVATPKLLTGVFSGSQVQSVTKTVTWT